MPQSAFTPAPVRPRHDGWTPAKQQVFIETLAETGCVSHAARSVGMSLASCYRMRNRADAGDFAHAWESAVHIGYQKLTDIAFERVIEGVAEPVFHKGEEVGTRRRYSDRLLMFLMRHHQPQLYSPHAGRADWVQSPYLSALLDQTQARLKEAEARADAAERAALDLLQQPPAAAGPGEDPERGPEGGPEDGGGGNGAGGADGGPGSGGAPFPARPVSHAAPHAAPPSAPADRADARASAADVLPTAPAPGDNPLGGAIDAALVRAIGSFGSRYTEAPPPALDTSVEDARARILALMATMDARDEAAAGDAPAGGAVNGGPAGGGGTDEGEVDGDGADGGQASTDGASTDGASTRAGAAGDAEGSGGSAPPPVDDDPTVPLRDIPYGDPAERVRFDPRHIAAMLRDIPGGRAGNLHGGAPRSTYGSHLSHLSGAAGGMRTPGPFRLRP